MTRKFTPGPWVIEPIKDAGRHSGDLIQVLATVGRYPSTVCTVEEYCEVPGFFADRLADARLIAAAPDLLKALWAMSSSFHAVEYMEPHMSQAADMARAAIAKATGHGE